MTAINVTIDVDAVRTQVTEVAQQVMAGQHLDVVISGALLLAIVALSLGSIWRTRRRTAVPKVAARGSMLQRMIPKRSSDAATAAAPMAAVTARPKRKSGSQATVKVVTPVSKVTAKLIRASENPMEIARRSGLSRDGVAMMMAAAAPKGVKPVVANTASAQKATVRQPAAGDAGRAMVAPGAYTQAQRIIPAKVERPGVGTRFNARVS